MWSNKRILYQSGTNLVSMINCVVVLLIHTETQMVQLDLEDVWVQIASIKVRKKISVLTNAQYPTNSQPAAYYKFKIISGSKTESESEIESHPDRLFDHIESQLVLLDDYHNHFIRSSLSSVNVNINANKGNDSEVMNTDIVLTLGDNMRTTLSKSLWC